MNRFRRWWDRQMRSPHDGLAVIVIALAGLMVFLIWWTYGLLGVGTVP